MTSTALNRRLSRRSEPYLSLSVASSDDASLKRNVGCSAENTTETRRQSSPCRPRPSPARAKRWPRATRIFRLRLPRLVLDRVKSYIKRTHPMYVSMLGLLLLFLLRVYVRLLWGLFVGPQGSIKGGKAGYLLDQYGRDYTKFRTVKKWREEVKSELHIPIVQKPIFFEEPEGALLDRRFWPFDEIIRTRPNYAVVEMLLQEKRRVQKLRSMVRGAMATSHNCSELGGSSVQIPTTVLQYLPHREQPPLPPYWIDRFEAVDIDFLDIHDTDIGVILEQAMKHCRHILAGGHLASADSMFPCLIQNLGGMQLSNTYTTHFSRHLISNIFSMMGFSDTPALTGGTCNSRVGYAVFSNAPTPVDQLRKTSAIASHVSTVFSAFPPYHPGSICIPPFERTIGTSPYNEANKYLSFQSTFANRLLTEIESKDFNGTSSFWGIATLPCGVEDILANTMPNCCDRVSVDAFDSLNAKGIAEYLDRVHVRENSEQSHHIIFTSSKMASSDFERINSRSEPSLVSVTIKETSNNLQPARKPKESIQMQLENIGCKPGWFCNRCLQSSIYGSFSKCASVCSTCAVNLICQEEDASTRSSRVKVDVQVTGVPWNISYKQIANARQHRIPRIIHQTYFDEIAINKYPQLFRLQNTWKAAGWEYRFYDDESARQYITANYPSRFVSVFDSLLPGAYKADFFRYLVLYKDGGVYADIDVMLNTNLDSFVSPDLAFFAPIDAVGTFADEQFCVWNGLMGSAPAHPALTHVIEWMVNLVSSRGDIYDMERILCGYSGTEMENWKLRAEPGLMLSGPCALGLAINVALGNEPLSKFKTGLVRKEGMNRRNVKGLNSDAIGNVMILLADKDDLGEFRFTDPERNIIVASTDLVGLSKAPLLYDRKNLRTGGDSKQKPHYSVSTEGEELWGTHDVYADGLVGEGRVTLSVSYK